MSLEAGNILRETRENKGISIKEASDALHIRIPYLQALENGRAEIIPSNVQTRGFLRIYSEFLDLDPVMMIREWDQPGSYPLQDNPADNKSTSDNVIPAPIRTVPDSPFPSPFQNQENPYQSPVKILTMDKPEQDQPENDHALKSEAPPDIQSQQTDPGNQKKEKKKKEKRDKHQSNPKNEQDLEAEAQKLFEEIGSQLSYRRKFLSLSLEDCESQTLIRSIYIESMENGKFDQLPSFIQARGMLNNYAAFLDLDVDEIMLKLATALQLLSQKKNKRGESRHKPTKKAGRMKQFFTPDLFIGIFVIVGIAGIIIYSAITIAAYRRNIAEPTPDLGISLLDQYLDTEIPDFLPTESATAPVEFQAPVLTEEPEETEIEEVQSSQPIQLFVTANQRTIMTVITDGKEAFSGRTIPNNTYPFDAVNQIELTTGNADAISVVYNQQNLGRLGKMGEVMTIIFFPNMAATPTPQFSATPTNTLEPTYTPQPETPMATNTPTPYIP